MVAAQNILGRICDETKGGGNASRFSLHITWELEGSDGTSQSRRARVTPPD